MGKISDLLKEASKKYEAEDRTTEDNEHYHLFEVNSEGNGKTTKTIGEVDEHVHNIEEFDVLEAKGHDHDIPKKKPKVNEINPKDSDLFNKAMDRVKKRSDGSVSAKAALSKMKDMNPDKLSKMDIKILKDYYGRFAPVG